jgi:hypothetical protein
MEPELSSSFAGRSPKAPGRPLLGTLIWSFTGILPWLQLSLEPFLHMAVSTKSYRVEFIDMPMRTGAESTECLRDRRPPDSGRRRVLTVHEWPQHKLASLPYRRELRPSPARNRPRRRPPAPA